MQSASNASKTHPFSRDSQLRVTLARVAPLAFAIIALLVGLWTSLARMGMSVDGPPPINHGPLMVGGFIGTVIALERAVALNRPWAFIAPWLGALSGWLLVFSFPPRYSALALLLSSIVLLLIFGSFLRKQMSDFTLIMAVGALCFIVGNAVWFRGGFLPDVVPWWAGFLILTIAGERIEMSRLRPKPRSAKQMTAVLIGLYFVALCLTLYDIDFGVRVSGAVLVFLCAWLIRYDIALHTIRGKGLPQYAAFSILTGYAWLVVSGLMGVAWGRTIAGFYYDAWLHAQFVGFVFVMIMAHAPIILPAVAGISVQFTPIFYAPVILLHLSLFGRVIADLMHSWIGRQWTGSFNIAAVLLFMGVTVTSVLKARQASLPHHKRRL